MPMQPVRVAFRCYRGGRLSDPHFHLFTTLTDSYRHIAAKGPVSHSSERVHKVHRLQSGVISAAAGRQYRRWTDRVREGTRGTGVAQYSRGSTPVETASHQESGNEQVSALSGLEMQPR